MSQYFRQDAMLNSLSLNFDMIDPGYLYTSSYVVLDTAVTKIQILTQYNIMLEARPIGMLVLFNHKNV